MENKRAFYLIERSNMSDKDKFFLKTHIERYEDLLNSLVQDLEMLKTINESLGGLDSKYVSAKENAIVALNSLYDTIKNNNNSELENAIKKALEEVGSIEAMEVLSRNFVIPEREPDGENTTSLRSTPVCDDREDS